jgi:hypothetical protein
LTLQHTPAGNKAFPDLTRREAVRGAVKTPPQHLSIVFDGELRSYPQIDYLAFPNGVDPSNGAYS